MSVVTEYLRFRGVEFQAVFHDRAPTSRAEASAIGVDAGDVLRTVVIDCHGGHALAVIPASRRLDLRRLRRATGDPRAHLADEDEILRDFFGYELGTIPPLGSLVGARTFVDPEVLDHRRVLFAGGSQTRSIRVDPRELFRAEPVTVVDLIAADRREERIA